MRRTWRFTDRAHAIAWTLVTLAILGLGAWADLTGWALR